MTMQSLPAAFKEGGGVGLDRDLAKAVLELQNLKFSVVTGAAAGTKMNVAALRTEDTVLMALKLANTWAAPVDDAANVTIQSVLASGTITFANAVPAANDTITMRGVTYTFKAAPTALTDILISDTVDHQAVAVAAAINAYENRWGSTGQTAPLVTAARTSSGVVTVTAVAEGTGPNSYTLAKSFATGANCTVSGSTLAGGTATGGIKSTTDLSAATLLLVWFDKNA